MKNFKSFESNINDPFNEENWEEEERILYPIKWYFDRGINYAMVGELMMGCYFKPSIERLLKNRFHIKIGLRIDNLEFVEEKLKTPAECKMFIKNWWYEFTEKISFHK